MRQMTKRGYDFLKREEGERLFVYDDATGIRLRPGDPIRGTATAGIGHTGKDVVPGMTVTREMSERWFDQDTDWAEACVEATCPGANDNEFDAMVSLCFNIGAAAFKKSSVARMWKKGDKRAAGNAFSLWCKTTIDGKLQDHPVLIARRARETAMFFTPLASEIPKPMPQAVENPGKVSRSGAVKAAAGATVAGAPIILENAKPALDAVESAVDAARQATSAWDAIKDLLSPLANGHVVTVILLAIALGFVGYIGYLAWRRIRRGEVSA